MKVQLPMSMIWLNLSIDESTKYCLDIIAQLRSIISTVYMFTNIDECIHFLTKIRNEKAFFIVSSSLSQRLIHRIYDVPHINAIHIFDSDVTAQEE